MATITVDTRHPGQPISRNLFGNFSEHLGRCIYNGVYVGEGSPIPNENGMRRDIVEALRKIHLPVLRWPGGCFADEYHWEDGIGPKASRRRMVNTNWGSVVEDNSFGTHEFLELCRQIGCEPYINANVGSGTVREMAEWVEYLNQGADSTLARRRAENGHPEPFGVKYWGVGNESWGCGGNMRPEYYADEFRRYQTYCRTYGPHRLYRIACGPSVDDYHWMEVLMERAARYMDGISLHHYTVPGPWEKKGSATVFDADQYYYTLNRADYMDELIRHHASIMDRFDPEKRIGLIVDEWGTWFDVEPGTNPGFLYQQNTMRDAMVAVISLHIFMKHADRVHMANLAQLINVLQALILTDGDQMLLTPTYHVFDLLQGHMDALSLPCDTHCGMLPCGVRQVTASASEKDGVITLTLANLSMTEPEEISLRLEGWKGGSCDARILSEEAHAHNTFDCPDRVAPKAFVPAPEKDGVFSLELPPCSLVSLTLRRA
ncbi:MAG: alpha-N-arabinofuranosidase [Clostridia bacterium]|nr:alpha-N-arabinofuranosidase [Clostridia bacterium]